jgi:hypothetical protein
MDFQAGPNPNLAIAAGIAQAGANFMTSYRQAQMSKMQMLQHQAEIQLKQQQMQLEQQKYDAQYGPQLMDVQKIMGVRQLVNSGVDVPSGVQTAIWKDALGKIQTPGQLAAVGKAFQQHIGSQYRGASRSQLPAPPDMGSSSIGVPGGDPSAAQSAGPSLGAQTDLGPAPQAPAPDPAPDTGASTPPPGAVMMNKAERDYLQHLTQYDANAAMWNGRNQSNQTIEAIKAESHIQGIREQAEAAERQIQEKNKGRINEAKVREAGNLAVARVRAQSAQGVAQTQAGARVQGAQLGYQGKVDSAQIGADARTDSAQIGADSRNYGADQRLKGSSLMAGAGVKRAQIAAGASLARGSGRAAGGAPGAGKVDPVTVNLAKGLMSTAFPERHERGPDPSVQAAGRQATARPALPAEPDASGPEPGHRRGSRDPGALPPRRAGRST